MTMPASMQLFKKLKAKEAQTEGGVSAMVNSINTNKERWLVELTVEHPAVGPSYESFQVWLDNKAWLDAKPFREVAAQVRDLLNIHLAIKRGKDPDRASSKPTFEVEAEVKNEGKSRVPEGTAVLFLKGDRQCENFAFGQILKVLRHIEEHEFRRSARGKGCIVILARSKTR